MIIRARTVFGANGRARRCWSYCVSCRRDCIPLPVHSLSPVLIEIASYVCFWNYRQMRCKVCRWVSRPGAFLSCCKSAFVITVALRDFSCQALIFLHVPRSTSYTLLGVFSLCSYPYRYCHFVSFFNTMDRTYPQLRSCCDWVIVLRE
jgi:hypothetical protein